MADHRLQAVLLMAAIRKPLVLFGLYISDLAYRFAGEKNLGPNAGQEFVVSIAMINTIMTVFAAVLLTFSGHGKPSVDLLQDGDIIFHTSRSAQSVAIQKATRSKYSHMGIVFLRNGKPYVYEAIRNVQYTPLEKWIARGDGGHYVAKRLRAKDTALTSDVVAKLRRAAGQLEGKPYDLTFEWSDDRIYCSELVWKIYDRGLGVQLGRLQKLRDFDLSDVAVKAKMKERYGKRIPMDETVISPAEMFACELLRVVAER